MPAAIVASAANDDDRAGPLAARGSRIEQPEPAREGQLQIHRRDRRIEERARRTKLTADDVETGPEERERPHHPRHLRGLEHRDDRDKNSHGEERADYQARARCAIDDLGDDKRHRPRGGEPPGKSKGVASLDWRCQRREHDNCDEREAGEGDRRPRDDRGPRVPDQPQPGTQRDQHRGFHGREREAAGHADERALERRDRHGSEHRREYARGHRCARRWATAPRAQPNRERQL